MGSRKELEASDGYHKHISDKEMSKNIFLDEQKKSKGNYSFLCVSFYLQKV